MPPPSGVRLRVGEKGITLLASAAPRRDLLAMLSRELGFELLADDVGNEPVTARAEGVGLAELVPRLLPDRSYRIDYRLDPVAGHHVVARLEVAPLAAPLPAPPPETGAPEIPGLAAGFGGETPSPEASADAGRWADADAPGPKVDESRAVNWKELLLRLDDADPDERIEALEEIDPDGEGLTLITDRLTRDPDPRVRVVAAEKLEFAETLAAVDALVLALDDPDPKVVLAAIDALEFTDDVTVVNDLAPLLQHPDPEIREAAADAIEFIGDDDEEED